MSEEYVQRLEELGFGIARSSLAEGVREFEGYASLPRAARAKVTPTVGTYSDLLESVELLPAERFHGTPQGKLDDESVHDGVKTTVAELIRLWQERRLRCPVVVEAWRMKKDQREECVDPNVWRFDQAPDKRWRFFARDFSGELYALADPPARWPVGEYTNNAFGHGPYGTQRVGLLELVPAALLAEALPGPGTLPSEPPSAADCSLSSFRVVRAVYERECVGYLDALNAYDKAGLSSGGFHCTISSGELGAYVAFALDRHPERSRFMAPWGMAPKKPWSGAGVDLFEAKGGRRYLADWTWPDPMPPVGPGLDALRSWHWVTRFQALARSSEMAGDDYRFARLRLRNVLEAPFRANAPVPRHQDGSPVLLGEVFRSELAAAFLLRWHVNIPGNVVSGGFVAKGIEKVVKGALPGVGQRVEQLDDADEAALLAHLRVAPPAAVRKDFTLIETMLGAAAHWKVLATWGGAADEKKAARKHLRLGTTRTPGFLLDERGMPPRPY